MITDQVLTPPYANNINEAEIESALAKDTSRNAAAVAANSYLQSLQEQQVIESEDDEYSDDF